MFPGMSCFTALLAPVVVLLTLGKRYGRIGRNRQYKQTAVYLPVFVIIVWCSRPFIGVVLAMLSYLLLNAGLFAPFGNVTQHMMLSSLLAVLTGYCEGWLFSKQIA